MKFKNSTLHVKVTERDNAQAKELAKTHGHAACCPNALAINRALRAKFRRHKNIKALVGCATVNVYDNNDRAVEGIYLPEAGQKVVQNFDFNKPFTPAEYDLELLK